MTEARALKSSSSLAFSKVFAYIIEVMCLNRGDSMRLDNVIEAFNKLGGNPAHRKQIAEKVPEIRKRRGLHLGNYVAWT